MSSVLVNETRLFRGQGIVSIAELSANGSHQGFMDIGNVRLLRISPTVERIEHMEMRTGKQNKDKVLERTRMMRVEFEAESTVAEFLRRIFYGEVTTQSTATITGEIVKGYRGRKQKLQRINLTSFTSLTNSNATYTYTRDTGIKPFTTNFDATPDVFIRTGHGLTNGTRVWLSAPLPTGFSAATNYYVVNATANNFQLSATFAGAPITTTGDVNGVVVTVMPDYRIDLKSGVITFLSTADGFADGDNLLANYAAGGSETVRLFKNQNKDTSLLFEGLNTAEDDAPVIVELFKIRLDPPSEWSLIGDEFSVFNISGEVLYDQDKEADGGFGKITQLQV